ncbi:MAG: hypothetical protein ABIV51_00400 [Saprospiraceae bacterium]
MKKLFVLIITSVIAYYSNAQGPVPKFRRCVTCTSAANVHLEGNGPFNYDAAQNFPPIKVGDDYGARFNWSEPKV